MKSVKTFAVAAASMIAVSVGLAAAPAAQAGTGDCSGSLILRRVVSAGGTGVGELVVYYNASTGNNCARFNHIGPSYGVARETNVFIEKCPTNNPARNCFLAGGPNDSDLATYAYYAGPVQVHSPSTCVRVYGYIRWNGAVRDVEVITGC
ncbi:hypothetical protein GCM10027446_13550 [Angustibacter peucedani]